ncbi:MAG: hypothetical protein UX02_C0002G0073 [Candidatus Moranbacteria bacterium GW2011_GWC1_45_18]|nr:MAG: hypothetical protein UT79_C0001G0388 [Candidatus Moranbacteria bacterium GW2011_GWC2_40_12]KKT99754.1 MAG: hypothetical protein UX02_C0002G0073 [Candidatus Moranbacteria bacterium GW2011_GWC1_45_18]OGI23676.1 MAG: hypothetical protein A2194_03255 [Candidatus Moranbacteria bacterium RIFOXYA1_FULL_44_8]OGI35297.1 MAG: hypothetical protein A2407_01560 [Candidatus Moranbacteria bacterium RIFOXYC1_FULL_44_8]OGI39497.1 MAG: hypothetical protein A2374_03160 [Candidatus Moranbacteria bacterium 
MLKATNDDKLKKINDLIQKVDEMKKADKMDLSSDQDLSIAIMNLVSIEEHFFFTGAKTGKPEYYDMLQEVRAMRGDLLRKIVKNPEGEQWCISKHLLAASMRLMEVGTKQHKAGNQKEALELFEKSFDCYSLFWGINMDLIKTDDIKKIDEGAINVHDTEKKLARNTSRRDAGGGFLGKLGELVKKAVDCCLE